MMDREILTKMDRLMMRPSMRPPRWVLERNFWHEVVTRGIELLDGLEDIPNKHVADGVRFALVWYNYMLDNLTGYAQNITDKTPVSEMQSDSDLANRVRTGILANFYAALFHEETGMGATL